MNVRYRVTLTHHERDELKALLSGGKSPARKLKRAQILSAADAGQRRGYRDELRGWRLDGLSDQAALRRR
jgi:hypothetical protein